MDAFFLTVLGMWSKNARCCGFEDASQLKDEVSLGKF
jgi:hypothetical protein